MDQADASTVAASIKTQSSFGSSMSSFVRRATRRDPSSSVGKSPLSDNASVKSGSSRTSSIRLPRLIPRLDRQVSSNSLSSQRSNIPHDARSIVSTRSIRSAARSDYGSSRSRPYQPPPSSFSPRRIGLYAPEDDRLQSSADIRAEIAETEAESKRLLDAFDGLEQSALARHRADLSKGDPEPSPLDNTDATWTIIPDQSSGYTKEFRGLQNLAVDDTVKDKSNGHRNRRNPTEFLSVLQFNTASDRSSGRHQNSPTDYASLIASTMHSEVNDIRRRRVEVTDRYQQRLDYLKARLKGAEIHERLLRK